MTVAPDEGLANARQQIVNRTVEVDPPHRVHDEQPANDERDEIGEDPPAASADWIVAFAARIDSPSTINVSRPYRSVM